MLIHIKYKDKNGCEKHKFLSKDESYYYYYYLNGFFLREACYSCKYSCLNRESDFTIGDYWGVNVVHPEIKTSNGISLLLVNTSKGQRFLRKFSNYMFVTHSNIEFAIKENGQLVLPSVKKDEVDILWDIYLTGGAEAVQNYFIYNHIKCIVIGRIKRKMPLFIRDFFNGIFKLIRKGVKHK